MGLNAIGGISAGSISMSQKLTRIQENISSKTLGHNLSQSVTHLITAMRSEIASNFSGSSLGKVNDLFSKFFTQLDNERPDLILDLIDDARFKSLNATMGDTFTTRPSDESLQRRADTIDPSALAHRQFNVTVLPISSDTNTSQSRSVSIEGRWLAGAMVGDPRAIQGLINAVSGLSSDQVVHGQSAVYSSTASRDSGAGDKPTALHDASPPKPSLTITSELAAQLSTGNGSAIKELVDAALTAIAPTDPAIQSEATVKNPMLAAIMRYREMLSRPINGATDSETVSSVVSVAISKGVVEWANKTSDSTSKNSSNDKRNEAIKQIIRKIQDHLSDGLDGLDELSELRGLLMSVDGILENCPGLLDDIKTAFNQYMSQQSGNLDKNSAKQLMQEANAIIASSTGSELFSESEIESIADSIGQNNGLPATGQDQGPNAFIPTQNLTNSEPDSTIHDSSSATHFVPFAKPINVMNMLSALASTSSKPMIAATSSLSGDTSSDKQRSQSRIAQIIDFLDSVFTEGIDQALDKVLENFETKHLISGREVDPFSTSSAATSDPGLGFKINDSFSSSAI